VPVTLHVLAVQHTPDAHVDRPEQPTVHLSPPQVVFPAQLDALHVTLVVPVALLVIPPLHELRAEQLTVQSEPPQVMAPHEAAPEHVMVHFEAWLQSTPTEQAA